MTSARGKSRHVSGNIHSKAEVTQNVISKTGGEGKGLNSMLGVGLQNRGGRWNSGSIIDG